MKLLTQETAVNKNNFIKKNLLYTVVGRVSKKEAKENQLWMNEKMVAIFHPVHQKQTSPATVSPSHQGIPQCFHSNSPPDVQVIQNGETRVPSILNSAKVPNLIYEEDDLGKEEKCESVEIPEDSLIEELEEEASLEDDLMTVKGQAPDSHAEDSEASQDI